MTMFFGFAVADSMFSGNVVLTRRELSAEQAKSLLEGGFTLCLNESHKPTVEAARSRFGIEVTIPAGYKAPQVSLRAGDSLVVMSVRGLPRLDTTRHEYTAEEIGRATFTFSHWTVEGAATDSVAPELVCPCCQGTGQMETKARADWAAQALYHG